MTKRKVFLLAICSVAISACGGGSGGSGEPPEPPVTSTYTVTLTDVVVVRSADSMQLDSGGIPVDGATVTITE